MSHVDSVESFILSVFALFAVFDGTVMVNVLGKTKDRYLNCPLSFAELQPRLNWFSYGGLLDWD